MSSHDLGSLVATCVAIADEKEVSVSLAETTTGGKIGATIAEVSGASRLLESSIVAYGFRSRIDLLGVSPDLLDQYGAVSKEAAEAMADGMLQLSNSLLVLAETGIAGPSGGTLQKPVGLVHLVVKSQRGYVRHRACQFQGNRIDIQQQIVQHSLQELLTALRAV
ncbi:MAG: CinA family protein [Bacteroidota bacterium]